MNWSLALAMLTWPATVTWISTVPLPTGLVAVQKVAVQLTTVAAFGPKLTVLGPDGDVRFWPVIATTVPPPSGP